MNPLLKRHKLAVNPVSPIIPADSQRLCDSMCENECGMYVSYRYKRSMSFAHKRAAVTLERDARKALGEEISWLVFTWDFVELHFARGR